jgi:hypothetical protein
MLLILVCYKVVVTKREGFSIELVFLERENDLDRQMIAEMRL